MPSRDVRRVRPFTLQFDEVCQQGQLGPLVHHRVDVVIHPDHQTIQRLGRRIERSGNLGLAHQPMPDELFNFTRTVGDQFTVSRRHHLDLVVE